jgi:hypothetical protein
VVHIEGNLESEANVHDEDSLISEDELMDDCDGSDQEGLKDN